MCANIVEPGNWPFEVRFETIDPDRAAELLATNPDKAKLPKQRSISLTRVDRYLDDIANGWWAVTHQGIAIDEQGILMDGQHRLKAIIEADKPIISMVCIGVPRDTFTLMDGGFTRAAHSFLEGPYRTQRAALARTWLQLQENKGTAYMSNIGNGKFPSHRILRLIDEREDLREYGEAFSGAAVQATGKGKFKGTSTAGLLIGGFIVDPEHRLDWWDDIHAMANGDGLPDGNPIKALYKTGEVGGNMTNVNYMRAIYAAVKYRDGVDSTMIRAGRTLNIIRVW